jgi:hypothetical protein
MMVGKARVWLACVMMVIVMAVAAASKTPQTGTAASHIHHDGAGGANDVQNTTTAAQWHQVGNIRDNDGLQDSHDRGVVVADATPTPPLKLVWSRPVLVSGPTEALPAGPPVPDGFESFDNSHALGVGNGGALMFTR